MPVPCPQCPERRLSFRAPATCIAKLSEHELVVTLLAGRGIQTNAGRALCARSPVSLWLCLFPRPSGTGKDAACAVNAWSELRGRRVKPSERFLPVTGTPRVPADVVTLQEHARTSAAA